MCHAPRVEQPSLTPPRRLSEDAIHMQTFLQTVVLGLGTGSLDALLAVGLVLIYRTTGILNFSLASAGTISSYVTVSVASGRPLVLGVGAGIACGALLGLLTDLALRRVLRNGGELTAAVGSLAVAVLFAQVVHIAWGGQSGQFPAPFGVTSLSVGGIVIPELYLSSFVTSGVLAVALGGVLRCTRTGRMIRALSDSPETAELCGANRAVLVGSVFACAGALSAVASFFAAQIVFDPSFMDPFFLAALIAAVLGGLRSLPTAFVASLLLEVARTLFQAYAPGTISLYTQTFLLVLLVAVLALARGPFLLRPIRTV